MITLATLPQATEQEVFDQVAVHLLKQRAKSMGGHSLLYDNDPICMYRNPEGLMCAAGCLISEAEYKPEMEDKDWNTLSFYGIVPSAHYKLIWNLQGVHDHKLPQDWKEAIIDVAVEFNLSYESILNMETK